MSATIQGLQEAQAANAQAIAAARPDGGLGRAIKHATAAAHRYAVAHTPVDTGAWRASHRMALEAARGRVELQAGATNPRSRTPVKVYASAWEAKGGARAPYQRTYQDAGAQIAAEGGVALLKELP